MSIRAWASHRDFKVLLLIIMVEPVRQYYTAMLVDDCCYATDIGDEECNGSIIVSG